MSTLGDRDFLDVIWGPTGSWHSLCWQDSQRGLRYTAFDTPEALIARAEKLSGSDVWISVCAMAEKPDRRGGKDDVTHVPALFVDLDWNDPAHSKPETYPTEVEVRDRLSAFDLAPTHVVCTGHGLQAYWATKCPMGPSVAEGLQERLKRALTAAGLVCEAMGLGGVLRLPGSTNFKTLPTPVVIERAERRRYLVTELDAQLPEPTAPPLAVAAEPPDRSNGGTRGRPGPMDRVLEGLDLRSELERRGFVSVGDDGMGDLFRHPDATNARSVRINSSGRLFVFTESLPIPSSLAHNLSTYDALDVIAYYDHGGDRVAAARSVAPSVGVEWGVGVAATNESSDVDSNSEKRRSSARDVIVDLAERHYDIGRLEDERTFLVPHDGRNVALTSGEAKSHLGQLYRRHTGRTAGRSPLDEAWLTINGIAYDSEKSALPLRVGTTADGMPVLDLGDTSGRAVLVSSSGWSVVNRSPVTFRRSKAMLAIGEPISGGNIDELFDLLNVAEGNHDLFAAWMTSALMENLPHPAPVLRGEQGAAKSSTARAMTTLIDPCTAATQKPPRGDDDWAQTCSARWMVAVDNVSNVSEWWSDALCRTITGDGWLRRALYTDDDVVATTWRRCVILNGITLGANLRADLAERLVMFELTRPKVWLTESEVNAQLAGMRPRVLGALLDLVAKTLNVLPDTDTVRDLRMADFATFLAAFDQATGRTSLDAYRQQLDNVFEEAIESDAVAMAVIEMMEKRNVWTGKSRDLLATLHQPAGGPPPGWPTSAREMTNAMSRSAAMLRKVGISWTHGRKTKAGYIYTLARVQTGGDEGDGGDDAPPSLCLNEEKE